MEKNIQMLIKYIISFNYIFLKFIEIIHIYINMSDRELKRKMKQKEYKIINAEKIKEYNNKYIIINADKIREQQRQYRLKNKDKIKAYHKQRYLNKKLLKKLTTN